MLKYLKIHVIFFSLVDGPLTFTSSSSSALSRTSDKRSSDEFSLTGDGTTDRKVVIDQIDEVTKSIFREGRSPTNTIRMLDIDFL